MPWFPEFTSAVELARHEDQARAHADPVAEYFAALTERSAHDLEAIWPGEIVINDPVAGVVRGHHAIRQFVKHNGRWLSERHARTETLTSIVDGHTAVVELIAHLDGDDGGELHWPIAVVAESPNDRSVLFRTYCRRWPLDDPLAVRPPLLAGVEQDLPDVVGRFHAALSDGDIEGAVRAFAPTGYLRQPYGPGSLHQGEAELRSLFTDAFADGGLDLEPCALTDDGVQCAVEFTCRRWGRTALPPQAGLAVYERGTDGLLAAVRFYDEIDPPHPGH